METRNLDHRRSNFKGRTQFSAQEVRQTTHAYPVQEEERERASEREVVQRAL